jgi:hypothetical protein
MKTYYPAAGSSTLVSQLEKNSTQWLGNLPVSNLSFKVGQTFVTPATTKVDTIHICAEDIQCNGKIDLCFHEFDEISHRWGSELGKASIQVAKKYGDTWLRFDLESIRLEKNKTYGFILTSNDALVAISEVAWSHKDDKPVGEEWSLRSNERQDHFFNYFSLVYRVGLRHNS